MIAKLVMRPRVWNQLFRGAQQGSKRAINRLFEVAEPHIKEMAQKQAFNPSEFNEFYAKGCETFMDTITRQKEPVKKAQNYLLTCIRGQMLTLKEKMARYYRTHLPIGQAGYVTDSIEPNKLGTIIEKAVDKRATDPNTAMFLKEVLQKIQTLTPKKRQMLLSKLMGDSWKEAGKELGLSENYAAQTYKRAKAELIKWRNNH